MKTLIIFKIMTILIISLLFVSCGSNRRNTSAVPYYEFKTEQSRYTADNLGSNCPVFNLTNEHGSTLIQDLFIPPKPDFDYYFSIVVQTGGMYYLSGVDINLCASIGQTYGVDAQGNATGAGELENYFNYTPTVSRECSNFIQTRATWASIAWDYQVARCTIVFHTSD